MYLGAHVLLPEGFDAHPNARYPLVIQHGHFPATIGGWREEPPDPNLKPDYSDRFHIEGYNRIQEEHARQLYKDWTGPDYPRVPARRDPARQPVLRRLLRGELRQPRALRRRDHVRADPVSREEVPRRSEAAGRAFSTAGRRAAGRPSARRSSIPTSTTGRGRPAPIRSTSAPTRRQPLRGRERLRLEGAVEDRRDTGTPRLPRAHPVHRRADESDGARPRAEDPLGRPVRRVAGRVLAGRSRRLSRSRSGTSAPASSTRRSRPTGRRTTTSSTS